MTRVNGKTAGYGIKILTRRLSDNKYNNSTNIKQIIHDISHNNEEEKEIKERLLRLSDNIINVNN